MKTRTGFSSFHEKFLNSSLYFVTDFWRCFSTALTDIPSSIAISACFLPSSRLILKISFVRSGNWSAKSRITFRSVSREASFNSAFSKSSSESRFRPASVSILSKLTVLLCPPPSAEIHAGISNHTEEITVYFALEYGRLFFEKFEQCLLQDVVGIIAAQRGHVHNVGLHSAVASSDDLLYFLVRICE